jgi:hypothetical protein
LEKNFLQACGQISAAPLAPPAPSAHA